MFIPAAAVALSMAYLHLDVAIDAASHLEVNLESPTDDAMAEAEFSALGDDGDWIEGAVIEQVPTDLTPWWIRNWGVCAVCNGHILDYQPHQPPIHAGCWHDANDLD